MTDYQMQIRKESAVTKYKFKHKQRDRPNTRDILTL